MSKITFSCPKCDQRLSVPQAHGGKSGHCPACGQRFQIPLPPPQEQPRKIPPVLRKPPPTVPQQTACEQGAPAGFQAPDTGTSTSSIATRYRARRRGNPGLKLGVVSIVFAAMAPAAFYAGLHGRPVSIAEVRFWLILVIALSGIALLCALAGATVGTFRALKLRREDEQYKAIAKPGTIAIFPVCGVGLLAALLWLLLDLLPRYTTAREAYRQAQSMNNMRQIAVGMTMFEVSRGRFPMPAIYKKFSKTPLLSWRVRLLPELGHHDLYREFNLDEPWDSPQNRKLIPRMPKVYQVPSGTPLEPGETCYLVPVGSAEGSLQTVFSPAESIGTRDIDTKDGSSNTILLVEAAPELAVIWTKPDDLEFDPRRPLAGLLGHREDGFLIVFVDGRVQKVSAGTDPEMVRRLFFCNDGQPISFSRDGEY